MMNGEGLGIIPFDDFDNLFVDNRYNTLTIGYDVLNYLRADIYKTKKGVNIVCQVPGCAAEDVRIKIDDSGASAKSASTERNYTVSIEAVPKIKVIEEEIVDAMYQGGTPETIKGNVYFYGIYDIDKATAKVKNGVLSIFIPSGKTPEKKTIKVVNG